MGREFGPARLIVNADDFGLSHSINEAVLRAHREGILTTASLMVNGPACDEAVQIARQNPRLGVGLHLALVCGQSALPAQDIPGLVSKEGRFSDSPVSVGMRYFFARSLAPMLEREIEAQVAKFQATGLVMDHVNGHLNMHLHPTVFGILLRHRSAWGVTAMRLTQDPLRMNLRLASGRWLYRLSHAAVFGSLCRWAGFHLRQHGIRHTTHVFGLLQTGEVNESYLLHLIERLPAGDSELYSHPCLQKFKPEFDALVSPRVCRLVRASGVELIRYQDLPYD